MSITKVAVVTGASRGIGFEIATTLIAKGYRVVANRVVSPRQALYARRMT